MRVLTATLWPLLLLDLHLWNNPGLISNNETTSPLSRVLNGELGFTEQSQSTHIVLNSLVLLFAGSNSLMVPVRKVRQFVTFPIHYL